MKTCNKCLADKPETSFYAKDKTCKECRRSLVRKSREMRADYYRQYDRDRSILPHRVAARVAYQKTDSGKTAASRAKAKFIASNPEKRSAHMVLNNAVRDGHLLKPGFCQGCGNDSKLHGHHEDYSRPLDVIWLCSACHRSLHSQRAA